jgi:hypothetical protein
MLLRVPRVNEPGVAVSGGQSFAEAFVPVASMNLE